MDTILRHQGSASDATGKPRVLGWDAAGVVVGKGADVTGFAVGDEVYYAGELEAPIAESGKAIGKLTLSGF